MRRASPARIIGRRPGRLSGDAPQEIPLAARKGRRETSRAADAARRDPERTALGRFAEGLLLGVALSALVTIPLYFNPRTQRVFEPDKIAFAIALGCLALLALVLRAAERKGGPRASSAWREPILWAAVACGLALALGAALSVVPSVSVWGSYRRAHGLLAWGAWAALFAAVACAAQEARGRERLTRLLMAASVPVSLYALLQRAGIDSIPWSQYGAGALERAIGTLGNAIFLGAFLASVPILAAAGALEARASGRSPRVLAGYGLVALLALLGLFASQSRGPVLALLAGLGAFALLWLAGAGRARAALGLATFGLLSPLLVVGLGRSGLPGLGRMGGLLEAGSRTARERILAWEALGRLALDDPPRALIGHGLESLPFVLPPFADPELARLLPEQVFDRSHNLLWEWWVSAGLLGVAAFTALLLAAFHAAYRDLGWLRGPRDAATLVASGLGAGLLGLGGAFLAGSAALAAVLAPAAFLIGLLAFGAWRGLRAAAVHGAEREPPDVLADRAWLTAALALLVGYVVEGALGLPTAATAALLVLALGLLAARAALGRPTPREEPALPALDGLYEGLGLAAVAHAPLLLPFGLAGLTEAGAWWLLLLPAGLWLAADLLAPRWDGAGRRALARLGVLGLFLLLFLALASRVGGPTIAYALCLLAVLPAGAWLWARARAPGRDAELWRMLPYTAAALLALVAAWYLGLRPVLADAQLRAGLEAAARGEAEEVGERFRRARALWPAQPTYALYAAAAYRDAAVAPGAEPAARAAGLDAAEAELRAAADRAPAPVYLRALAGLERDRGDMADERAARDGAWLRAEAIYEEALERDPHDPTTRAELAAVRLRRGDAAGAVAAFGEALDVQPARPDWWVGLAHAWMVGAEEDAASAIPEAAAALEAAAERGSEAEIDALIAALADVPRSAGLGAPYGARPVQALVVVQLGRTDRVPDAEGRLGDLRERWGEDAYVQALEGWLAGRGAAPAP